LARRGTAATASSNNGRLDMKTKKQTKAKADTWKNAKIVELSLSEIACVAGGRRIIVYCTCNKCRGDV
jgi:hypothetical protein